MTTSYIGLTWFSAIESSSCTEKDKVTFLRDKSFTHKRLSLRRSVYHLPETPITGENIGLGRLFLSFPFFVPESRFIDLSFADLAESLRFRA